MRDRLSEIQNAGTGVVATAQLPDLETGVVSRNMAHFFEESLVKQVDETHSRALVAVSEEQGKDHSAEIDNLMAQITAMSGLVRKKLQDMDTANKTFESKNPGSSDSRILATQHAVIVKKFTDTMTEYSESQGRYQSKYKQKIQKQLLIVKPEASPKEIEDAVSGDGAIFAQQIMPGAQYLEARKALEDIQDQRRDIMKIEKSILELHQLFVDMSVFVNQQGELINQIDTHIIKAVEYTAKGTDELKGAVKLQRATRKKMCCLCFCLIILAILIGVGAVVITGFH